MNRNHMICCSYSEARYLLNTRGRHSIAVLKILDSNALSRSRSPALMLLQVGVNAASSAVYTNYNKVHGLRYSISMLYWYIEFVKKLFLKLMVQVNPAQRAVYSKQVVLVHCQISPPIP